LLGEQSNDVVCDRKERMNSWVASLLRQDWQCEPASVIWIAQAIPPIDSHQYAMDHLAEKSAFSLTFAVTLLLSAIQLKYCFHIRTSNRLPNHSRAYLSRAVASPGI
jgi:hypothetical protein